MTSQRITEAEVHEACADIAAQGEQPSALKILKKLGRGSLTTITRHLNSWQDTDEAHAVMTMTLPAVVQLPPDISSSVDELAKKIWAIAKNLADKELDSQRESLRAAEKAAQDRIDEACAFSDVQALKIEALQTEIDELNIKIQDEHAANEKLRLITVDAEKQAAIATAIAEQKDDQIKRLEELLRDEKEQRVLAENEARKQIAAAALIEGKKTKRSQ